MQFLFQIESTAEFNMSYKKNLFQGLPWVYFDIFLCSFRTTFHQHSVLFDLSSLKNTFSSEQTNVWFKVIGDYFVLPTEKIEEKVMKLFSISACLKVSYFSEIKFRKFWEFDQNMCNFVPEKKYFSVRKVKYAQISFL